MFIIRQKASGSNGKWQNCNYKSPRRCVGRCTTLREPITFVFVINNDANNSTGEEDKGRVCESNMESLLVSVGPVKTDIEILVRNSPGKVSKKRAL